MEYQCHPSRRRPLKTSRCYNDRHQHNESYSNDECIALNSIKSLSGNVKSSRLPYYLDYNVKGENGTEYCEEYTGNCDYYHGRNSNREADNFWVEDDDNEVRNCGFESLYHSQAIKLASPKGIEQHGHDEQSRVSDNWNPPDGGDISTGSSFATKRRECASIASVSPSKMVGMQKKVGVTVVKVLSCRSEYYSKMFLKLPHRAPQAIMIFHELAVGVLDAYQAAITDASASFGATSFAWARGLEVPMFTEIDVRSNRSLNKKKMGQSSLGGINDRKTILQFFLSNLSLLIKLLEALCFDQDMKILLKNGRNFKALRESVRRGINILTQMLVARSKQKCLLYFQLVQPTDTKEVNDIRLWNAFLEAALVLTMKNENILPRSAHAFLSQKECNPFYLCDTPLVLHYMKESAGVIANEDVSSSSFTNADSHVSPTGIYDFPANTQQRGRKGEIKRNEDLHINQRYQEIDKHKEDAEDGSTVLSQDIGQNRGGRYPRDKMMQSHHRSSLSDNEKARVIALIMYPPLKMAFQQIRQHLLCHSLVDSEIRFSLNQIRSVFNDQSTRVEIEFSSLTRSSRDQDHYMNIMKHAEELNPNINIVKRSSSDIYAFIKEFKASMVDLVSGLAKYGDDILLGAPEFAHDHITLYACFVLFDRDDKNCALFQWGRERKSSLCHQLNEKVAHDMAPRYSAEQLSHGATHSSQPHHLQATNNDWEYIESKHPALVSASVYKSKKDKQHNSELVQYGKKDGRKSRRSHRPQPRGRSAAATKSIFRPKADDASYPLCSSSGEDEYVRESSRTAKQQIQDVSSSHFRSAYNPDHYIAKKERSGACYFIGKSKSGEDLQETTSYQSDLNSAHRRSYGPRSRSVGRSSQRSVRERSMQIEKIQVGLNPTSCAPSQIIVENKNHIKPNEPRTGPMRQARLGAELDLQYAPNISSATSVCSAPTQRPTLRAPHSCVEADQDLSSCISDSGQFLSSSKKQSSYVGSLRTNNVCGTKFYQSTSQSRPSKECSGKKELSESNYGDELSRARKYQVGCAHSHADPYHETTQCTPLSKASEVSMSDLEPVLQQGPDRNEYTSHPLQEMKVSPAYISHDTKHVQTTRRPKPTRSTKLDIDPADPEKWIQITTEQNMNQVETYSDMPSEIDQSKVRPTSPANSRSELNAYTEGYTATVKETQHGEIPREVEVDEQSIENSVSHLDTEQSDEVSDEYSIEIQSSTLENCQEHTNEQRQRGELEHDSVGSKMHQEHLRQQQKIEFLQKQIKNLSSFLHDPLLDDDLKTMYREQLSKLKEVMKEAYYELLTV